MENIFYIIIHTYPKRRDDDNVVDMRMDVDMALLAVGGVADGGVAVGGRAVGAEGAVGPDGAVILLGGYSVPGTAKTEVRA